jgi:hypothetical protein
MGVDLAFGREAHGAEGAVKALKGAAETVPS